MATLHEFCDTSLYKHEGIVVNSNWKNVLQQNLAKEDNNTIETISFLPSNDEKEFEPIYETLIHVFVQKKLIDDFDNQIIQIVPSENF